MKQITISNKALREIKLQEWCNATGNNPEDFKVCTKCGEVKKVSEFNYINKAKGTRRAACSTCLNPSNQISSILNFDWDAILQKNYDEIFAAIEKHNEKLNQLIHATKGK